MTTYGLWTEKIYLDGQLFTADLVEQPYATRAGFKKIYAINGLPSKYEPNLVRSSQICNVPHTWRVKEYKSESEVTDEVLQKGADVLAKDMKELGAHIVTYIGEHEQNQDNNYEFLAAGAIRNKLSKDYQDNQYPVVSRAIVAPLHRGKGLGSLIVKHRMKVVLNQYFGKMPKAIHFGTESKKILHAVAKFEQEEDLKFVYIGDEQYTTSDGTHTVHDFLCFLPWFRMNLLDACDYLKKHTDSPQLIADFKEKLDHFMQYGIEDCSGTELEALHEKISSSFQSDKKNQDETKNNLHLIDEVFMIKKKIGACDPQT